jgi:apolipoprotein D and lipocalin family protein
VKNCCSRSKDEESYCAEGSAMLAEPEEKPLLGKMNVTFDEEQPDTPNYWVLATDYTNYAVVYYCKDLEDNMSSGECH